MLSGRLLAIAAVCGGLGYGQSNAMLDGTKAPTATPAETKPQLTIEARGDIFMARKMYREAIETFREGSPKDPILQNKIGIAYHQQLQLDSARKYYEQAIRLKPDYMEAINNLGTVYYGKKSYRRAISTYRRALKVSPEDGRAASIYMNLGTAYFARKNYEEATKSYNEALRLDADVFEHHGSFGVMLEERSVEERAKFHFYLAKLYAKGGRNELAIQYLRKALEEGYKDKKWVETPEFATIREMPEFKEIVAREPRVL
jgi:tetratricopeptide (TPR) repeat protein